MPPNSSPSLPETPELQLLFQTVPFGVAVIDREGRLLCLNETLARLAGHAPAALLGQSLETVLPGTAPQLRPLLAAVFAGGAPAGKAALAVDRDPQAAHPPLRVEAEFQPLKDEGGAVRRVLAMVRDTTGEHETRRAVERERARFAGAVRAIGGLAFEWDPASDTIEWNEGLEALTGFTAEEIGPGARGWIAHVVPEDAPKLRDASLHYLATGVNAPSPYRFVRKDGRIVWLISTIERPQDESGRHLGPVFGLVRDVTEAMRASEDLRASEERFRLLANLVPDLIWSAQPDGVTDWLNDRWREFFGLDLPRGLDAWERLIHPDDIGSLVPLWQSSVESGADFEAQYRMRAKTGAYRWFLGRAKPMRRPDGTILIWLGTATDIHDYRTALDDLRAAEEQRRLALEAGRIGAFQWDIERQRLVLSPEAEAMLALSNDDLSGPVEHWRSNVHAADQAQVKAMTAAAIAARSPRLQMEFRVQVRDAPVRWIESRGSIEYDAAGQPIRTTGVFVDITARKQQEERINLLLREMHHRVKNAFAMIAALIGLSAKSARDVPSYAEALRGRVQSLAVAHALSFADTENESVGVIELIHRLLVPFTLDCDPRVTIGGSARLRIAERQVSSLALALHELATNSVKHGALKHMEGRLSILVEATPDSGGAGIGIRWCETGVTPPSADTPSAAGFGSVLIERSLQQIGTTLHRRWEGERYLVDLVIPQ